MLARIPSLDELAEARRYREMLADAVPLTVDLRHEPFLAALGTATQPCGDEISDGVG